MSHPLFRVTSFELVSGYMVRIEFDDGTQQEIDFEPVLHGEMWGPLRDPILFNRVVLDPVAHTLTWPNGADFDPETLHNWSEYRDELTARARQWETVSA
jgi:hypothetical protein